MTWTSTVASAGKASDWVEGSATEFTIAPPRLRPESPMRSPQVPERSSLKETDEEIDVTDAGGPIMPLPGQQLRPRAPLEANISRWEQRHPGQFDDHGLGPMAEQLLWQTPLTAPPRSRIVPPRFFCSWLQSTHPDLKITSKNLVIEVKGKWDDASHALRSFGIPHTRANTGKVLESLLSGARVLVLSCAGWIPDQLLTPINKFVENGGYLITTDWALDGCLNRAFPGFVEWNGGYSSKGVVDAVVVAQDSRLFVGAVPYAHWKLDAKCQTIKVLKPKMVHVLVRSRQLMREDPDNLGILALTFKYGKGHVLHLVGHFDNNSDQAFVNALPDPAPGINISLRQALAANFLITALKSEQALTNEPVAGN